MSPGRRRSAADGVGTDRIFIEPAERRQAMLDVIAGARQRLVLSLFRCNDTGVLDALDGGARARRQGRSHPHQARQARQEAAARSCGRRSRRWAPSSIATRDPIVISREVPGRRRPDRARHDAQSDDQVLHAHVGHAPHDARARRSCGRCPRSSRSTPPAKRVLPRHRISPRLIIGPEGARQRMQALLASARRSIHVLDHKLSDPDLVSLLRERRAEGIAVSVIGHQPMEAIVPHGKLIIIDESLAVLGSTAHVGAQPRLPPRGLHRRGLAVGGPSATRVLPVTRRASRPVGVEAAGGPGGMIESGRCGRSAGVAAGLADREPA